ncbi:MAG: SH3 domain-containing protein [Myxococcota bacterium]
MLALLLLATGCGLWSREPTTTAPEPAPAVPSTAEPELRYVRASMLRLRQRPEPEAAWSALAINTRVRVVGREGEWVRIVAPDGRTGFVHRDFLGDTPLSLADIDGELGRAADPASRVTWAERAAALAPTDPERLGGLVEAYRAADRPDDAARVEGILRTGEADRFDRWFGAEAAQADEIGAALATVDHAEPLVALWERARVVTLAMSEPLAALFDPGQGFAEGDPRAMLAERMPWAQIAVYAGGTQPALELAPEPWLTAAARTPEAWDDALFELVTAAYETASARGWARWQQQNWDYGGCSTFGSGDDLHLQLLLRTDALAKVPPAAPAAAQIREAVLADILKPVPDAFPYCLAVDQPTPLDGLLREAQAILDQVALTEGERAALEARIAARFGEPGTGSDAP